MRLFSYVALSAAAYSALNIPSNLGMGGSRTLLCARVQLLVAGVHVVAWLRYASVGASRPRWERWYERALLVACASALVPGLAYHGGGRTRAFTPLGFVYAEATPTAWGLLLFAALLAVFALLAARYWLAWRRGLPHAAVHCVGLCVFLLMGVNDALAVASLAEMPHLLEVGLVVPVGAVAYSPDGLAPEEGLELQHLANSLPLKDVRSLERLVDEATLFLHLPMEQLPEEQQQVIREIREGRTGLSGKRVMIVDDDIRNIFALTSLLERHNMEIRSAETGRGAIERLQNDGDVDLVLVDIMMPDLDGYDTIREIRALPPFQSLPIVALTAKAMKGDREKCIEAGASDYIAKPVDPEQLLALLRLWLFR